MNVRRLLMLITIVIVGGELTHQTCLAFGLDGVTKILIQTVLVGGAMTFIALRWPPNRPSGTNG